MTNDKEGEIKSYNVKNGIIGDLNEIMGFEPNMALRE